MSSVGAIIVLVGLSGPVDTPRHTWPAPAAIQQPPAKWANRPPVKTKVVYADDALIACKAFWPKAHLPIDTRACAVTTRKPCLIILQSGMPPDLEDAVLKHEIGHCKGWPPGHPLK